MKKFALSVLVLSFVLSSFVFSAQSGYELKTAPGSLKIDGVLSDGEWDGAAVVSLETENTGMWANFYDENSRLPLCAYFFYGDEGIYVGADIYDNDVDTVNMHDCFEVAFNPGGLIPDGDALEGLFFTFWLDGEKILMKRHNRFDGDQVGQFEDGAVCEYKMTDHGYTVEALIRWEWLTLSDRPVLNAKTGKYRTRVLSKFDYKAEDAFTDAIVCYLNGNGDDAAPYRCVYRTVTSPELAGSFSTATYDIKFTFAKPAETTGATDTEQNTDAVTEPGTSAALPETETAPAEAGGNSTAKVIIPVAVCAAVVIAAAAAVILILKRRKARA